MKNRMIITLLLGLSASGIYAAGDAIYAAGDAYDIMNLHQPRNPWKPSKGLVELRKKDYDALTGPMNEARNKLAATNRAVEDLEDDYDNLTKNVTKPSLDDMAYYVTARDKLDRDWSYQSGRIQKLRRQQNRADRNYINARYYYQPTFPRIKRYRNSIKNWINSWY